MAQILYNTKIISENGILGHRITDEVMANEAKFSVIFSASGITNAQIETFEETAQRNNLPVSLPLRSDAKGNLIISSGMTLRNAQILRRQIVGYGFSADVVSDSVNTPKPNQNSDGSPTTLVVELNSIEPKTSEQPSASWGSMDMPSLDLGLSDGDILDGGESDWSGDNWLSPDESASRTLSVNAQDLLEVARGAEQFDLEDLNAVQAIPLLETLTKASQKGSVPVKPLLNNNLSLLNENDKPTVTNLMRESLDIETEIDNDLVPELTADSMDKTAQSSPELNVMDAQESKEAQEVQEPKEAQDSKESQDSKEAQEAQDSKEVQDSKESQDAQASKEAQYPQMDGFYPSSLATCISPTANAPEKFVNGENDSKASESDGKSGAASSKSEKLSDLSTLVTNEDSKAHKHRPRPEASDNIALESENPPAKSSKSVIILVALVILVAAALVAAYFLGFI